ncbi:MAG TPA: hypothetical protein VFA89_04390 [Terriglobales bacterium]|nr:hypothetical protein [Terriglobales bacterium]
MTARANFVVGSVAGLIVGAIIGLLVLRTSTVSPFDDGIYLTSYGDGCDLYAPVLTLNKKMNQQVSWRSVDATPQTYTIHFTTNGSPFPQGTCNPSCTIKAAFNPGPPRQDAHGYFPYEIIHNSAACKKDTDSSSASAAFNDPGLNIKP